MYKNQRISLCLPCRNEGKHLQEVLKRVPAVIDEVIVISNRSNDDTVKAARQLGAKVIVDDRVTADGIGYGFAHMSGLQQATGDIIMCADGDGTYPIDKVVDVIRFLLQNDLDVISCNRYPLQVTTRIPWKLRFGVGLLNAEVRVLYGYKMNDILSGMWVLKQAAKDQLQLTEGGWDLSPQIKLNALRNPSLKFAEYHIAQHARMGVSHQRYFKTGLAHAMWILKNRFLYSQKPSFTTRKQDDVAD